MDKTPLQKIVVLHKLQILKTTEESAFFLNAFCRDKQGATVELELYLKTPSNQEALARYEQRINTAKYLHECIDTKEYISTNEYLLITFPHVDATPLWEDILSHKLSTEHCLELMQALEFFYKNTKDQAPSNFITLIPTLKLSGPKPKRKLLVKSTGCGAWIESWKFKQQLYPFCADSSLNYKEQFCFLRNKLMLQLVSGSTRPLNREHLSDPLLNELYQEIYESPDSCQLLLSDLHDKKKSLVINKNRKRSFIFLSLIALVFLAVFINSSTSATRWLGKTFIEALGKEAVAIEQKKRAESTRKKLSLKELEQEKVRLINLIRSGQVRKALKLAPLMRIDFADSFAFEAFETQLTQEIQRDFDSAMQLYQASLKQKNFPRSELILENLVRHYPSGKHSQKAKDLLEALPLKKAQTLQEINERKRILKTEYPYWLKLTELSKQNWSDPLKKIKHSLNYAKNSLDKINSSDMRYLINCEILFLESEFKLFRALLKKQNTEAAKQFLKQEGMSHKNLLKLSPTGFEFEYKIKIAFSNFVEQGILTLMEKSLDMNDDKYIALSKLTYKYQLYDLQERFRNQIIDPVQLKSLEFVENYGKIKRELNSLQAMEKE